MALTDVVARLLATSETAVLALWERHLAGEFGEDEFVTLAAAEIARHDARATTAGDLAVAVAVTAQLGRGVAPVGLPIVDHQSRLRDAVRTVLRADVDYPATAVEAAMSRASRLGRLARAEPASAAQSAVQVAMERQPMVRGWRRKTDSSPCALCRKWADGKVRPTGMRMNRHTGCSCVQQPVVTE